MESKIEKLKIFFKKEDVSFEKVVIEKINEIIDHLNSQDQEEEEVNKMYDFNERKITTYIVDEDKVITILRQDEMPEWLKKGDIRVFKNTPEEYRSPEVLGAIARGYSTERNRSKVLDPDLCEDIGIEVQQLLEEREREMLEKLRLAFHMTFFKSGELWFDYLFEDGDTEAEQEAKETVGEYWEEVLENLSKLKEDK